MPKNSAFERKVELTKQPSYTYHLSLAKETVEGMTDGREAIKQAIYKILNTERYENLIYSWNYGIELKDLFGKPAPYVYALIQRRIEEALTQDDRIQSVEGFSFSKRKGSVAVSFTVKTIEGDIKSGMEVALRV